MTTTKASSSNSSHPNCSSSLTGPPTWTGGSGGKESGCNAGGLGSIPGLGRSFRGGNGYAFLLPGEFHGQRNLAGYSPWGRKELDKSE